jgi:dihydroorotate dehydrogenase (NAD+) catalytic subunit
MGGIQSGEGRRRADACGGNAVAVGTAMFRDPYAPLAVQDGIARYLEAHGYASASQLTGAVLPW